MILFPRKGRRYWYVTDIHEILCPVPVIVERRGGLFEYSHKTSQLWTVRWWLAQPKIMNDKDPGYFEEFDASRRDLYKTQKQAQKTAALQNKKLREARQREDY